MSTIMVIAAHPDDEILGCGATMSRHVQQGDKVHIVIMAEGITSRSETRNAAKYDNEIKELMQCSRQAAEIIGASSLEFCGFPDNRMDSIDLLDLIKVIEKKLEKYQPSIVYTHHAGDLNIDHRQVHQAVVTACRPVPGQIVQTMLFFEVTSSTEWQMAGQEAFFPNWYVDVSATMDNKMRALKEYESEMRSWPHTRSLRAVEHLLRWRGAAIGVEAAEAFMLGRNLVRGI